jgi:hypothetical protein
MGIFNRFFGRRDQDSGPSGPLVANPDITNPRSLQVVLSGPLRLTQEALGASLRAYHRELAGARCELDSQTVAQGTPFGLAGWGKHVVRIVGFDQPLPPQVMEACVAPSHYGDDQKEQVRRTQSHVLLYYAGYEDDPVEQFVALAAVAGNLAPLGGLAVLNESARTSLPIGVIAPGASPNMMEHLRVLPLLMLYAGFIKGEVPGIPGVWLRTFGCPLLDLPDLAMHLPGHEYSQETFELFETLLSYLRSSGATFAPGHTSQVGEGEYLAFRAPRPDETFLYAEGPLLIAERITSAEINRPGR